MAHHNCYLLQHFTCSAHIGPTGDNVVTMLCQLYVARAKKKTKTSQTCFYTFAGCAVMVCLYIMTKSV